MATFIEYEYEKIDRNVQEVQWNPEIGVSQLKLETGINKLTFKALFCIKGFRS